ncbi:MAG: glycosyltransferase family 2 protein [Melioribacteraceae bacterium]|nr:glycosyltransferase family 2 protein [Melioribacteraceae bacterium]
MENSAPKKKNFYNKKKYYKNKNESNPEKKNESRFSFKKVSLVIPLLNEEESLMPLYNEIKKIVDKLKINYEIVFIDDGSTDSSLQKLRELNRKDRNVRYISFRKNYGKSAALNVGFKKASGDAIITMDADLQDDPAEIENLLEKLDNGWDMVSGWKKVRFDPFVKKHSSKFFNYTTRVLTKIKIHDFNCGLKAYKRDVIKNINVYGELHRYIPVLAYNKGFTVTEIPVKHHPRRYGKTKFGISRFFKGFIDLLTVMFDSRYIKRPMHLFGFFGVTAFILGVLVNLWLSYEKIFLDKNLGDRPILLLGILLIVVGVQFFAVGLLGEIIVHNTPRDEDYNIKEKR